MVSKNHSGDILDVLEELDNSSRADTNPEEKVVSLLDALVAKIMKEASDFAANETSCTQCF